jgi:uncharacterized membrane protein YcaP (DUF421 family)
MDPLWSIGVRVVLIYLYVLIAVRLAGKRTVSEATPLDFVTGLILGDMFDGPFFGEVPVPRAFTCFTTVVFLHLLVGYASYRSPRLYRLFFSSPVAVIRNGRWMGPGLRKERLPREEVLSLLRTQGIEDITQVKEALMEPGGGLSVLRMSKKP